MEDFTDTSEVSELNCDARHIFHTQCLEEWLRKGDSAKCPLCKKEIKADADAQV